MTDQEFERQKVCYEQNFEQARSLNEQMNRVPALAMTLTGGLWFGAGVTENLVEEIRFALLLFAGICNVALVLSVLRIRDVLESYLEKLEAFHEKSFASGRPSNPKMPILGSYSMISIYCALIILASISSFIGAFWLYWPFTVPWWWGVLTLAALFLLLYLRLFRRNRPQTGAGRA
jgi:hypothetical protein